MPGPRQSPPQVSHEELRVLLICSDTARRGVLEQCCAVGGQHIAIQCVPDVSSALFKLAANAFRLAILDEVSLGPSPASLEGMMKSLNRNLSLLFVIPSTELKSRSKVLTKDVTAWVSNYYSRWARTQS